MTKYARLSVDGTDRWGIVGDDAIDLMDASPYEQGRATGTVVALGDAQLLSPVTPSKIYCLGRNYSEHVQEMGYTPVEGPAVFMKGATTITATGTDVVLPPRSMSTHIEHEAELAVVIGKPARFVSEEDAADYIFGYTCADDVSARDLQRGDPHPTRGKGFDTFCPVGPWIETDVDPAAGLAIRLSVNGAVRQDGSTADMIHSVPALIAYLSGFATLLPGDLILTGSPGGTGALEPGDRVEIEIEGVGTLVHGVVAADRP